MKTSFILALGIASLFSVGCQSQKGLTSATVITDCTGMYLRQNGKDYLVCNRDKLTGFKAQDEVLVTFEKTDDCPELKDGIVCMMYHENEGMVRITSIKGKN